MPSTTATEIQERDFSLLRGLFESRIMTLGQAAALHFDNHMEAAKKRVQKLKAAGYIGERPRRPYEPSVLFLNKKAFALLRDNGKLNDYPALAWQSMEKRARVSPLTVRHELDVMAVKSAMTAAINATDRFRVVEFCTWPLLYAFRARRPALPGGNGYHKQVWVKPDGYLRVRESEPDGGQSEHTIFLELDRSTETHETLRLRANCYLDYFKSGGLAVRFGHRQDEFKEFPFRVCWILKNAERRNNAAVTLLNNNPPILTMACLTTFEEILATPLSPIWIRPLDYRNTMTGTPFDPMKFRQANDPVYRRQMEREDTVESRIAKKPLFIF